MSLGASEQSHQSADCWRSEVASVAPISQTHADVKMRNVAPVESSSYQLQQKQDMNTRKLMCTQVCMHTSQPTNTHVHTHMHAYTHACTYVLTYASTHACACMHVCVCAYACTHTCTHARAHACMHAHIHTHTHKTLSITTVQELVQ